METSNQNQQQQQSKIRSLIAPDVERRKELRSTFKEISYYLLIGIISIIIIIWYIYTIIYFYMINWIIFYVLWGDYFVESINIICGYNRNN